MNHFLSIERSKPPSLSRHLPKDLRQIYHTIPRIQRQRFKHGLHEVKRWGKGRNPEMYGDVSYLPIPPDFSESDLEHTIGILDMVNVIERLYTNQPLGQEVNWNEIRVMAIIHDAGEIRTGDAPNAGPHRQSPRWRVRKEYEPVAVYDILGQLDDLELTAWLTALFDRYLSHEPTDSEAAITHYLDKAQGSLMTGPIIFNNFRQFGHNKPSEELTAHVTTSLGILHQNIETVFGALGNRASLNFRDYAQGLYGRLDQDAYRAPLFIARSRLNDSLIKSIEYKR